MINGARLRMARKLATSAADAVTAAKLRAEREKNGVTQPSKDEG
jgi:hypothetical protein